MGRVKPSEFLAEHELESTEFDRPWEQLVVATTSLNCKLVEEVLDAEAFKATGLGQAATRCAGSQRFARFG